MASSSNRAMTLMTRAQRNAARLATNLLTKALQAQIKMGELNAAGVNSTAAAIRSLSNTHKAGLSTTHEAGIRPNIPVSDESFWWIACNIGVLVHVALLFLVLVTSIVARLHEGKNEETNVAGRASEKRDSATEEELRDAGSANSTKLADTPSPKVTRCAAISMVTVTLAAHMDGAVNIDGKQYRMIGMPRDPAEDADDAAAQESPPSSSSSSSSSSSDAVGRISIGVVSDEQCRSACAQEPHCKAMIFNGGSSQDECQLLTYVALSDASAQPDAGPAPSQQPVPFWTYDTRPYTGSWIVGAFIVNLLLTNGVQCLIARYKKSVQRSSKPQTSEETADAAAQKATPVGVEIEPSGGAPTTEATSGKTSDGTITPRDVVGFVCMSALSSWVWSLVFELCRVGTPLKYVPGVLCAVAVVGNDIRNRASASRGTKEASPPSDVQPEGAAETLDKTAAPDAASTNQKIAKPANRVYLAWQRTRAGHHAASAQDAHVTLGETVLLITSFSCISNTCHLAFQGFTSYVLASIYLQSVVALLVLGDPKLTLIVKEGLLGCTVCWETLVSLIEEWKAYLEAQRRRREDGDVYDMVEREDTE
ncbi:hypothetical protein LTR85_004499 [Meristemomyces frigidus]|nr:hypothetical protein LTR85_004499 [Meristemomyces frigidus]